MFSIKTLHVLDTKYAADSIEWCPHPDYKRYFVCGTYELEDTISESTTSICHRKGRIILYKFDTETTLIQEIEHLETAAILDMKWLPQSFLTITYQPILGVANSLGQICVYKLNVVNHLEEIICINLDQDNVNLLALSLDWNGSAMIDGSITTMPSVLISDSKGSVHLYDFHAERPILNKLNSWVIHNYETWICTFDKWNNNIFYSGGDDTFLNAYDLRTSNFILTNKSHNAGVTSLLSHYKREHLLLTGSYDEYLRVFDTRSMKRQLFELNLGGGIWRLKSDPLDGNFILAACMYHNFNIIDLRCNSCLPEIVAEYNEHKSICYGADWCTDIQQNNDQFFMATCSFYDHKLCISEFKIK